MWVTIISPWLFVLFHTIYYIKIDIYNVNNSIFELPKEGVLLGFFSVWYLQ